MSQQINTITRFNCQCHVQFNSEILLVVNAMCNNDSMSQQIKTSYFFLQLVSIKRSLSLYFLRVNSEFKCWTSEFELKFSTSGMRRSLARHYLLCYKLVFTCGATIVLPKASIIAKNSLNPQTDKES